MVVTVHVVNNYIEEELIAQYKGQYKQLRKVWVCGEKFAKICAQMESQLKRAVEDEYAEICCRTEKEKENITLFFASHESFLNDVTELKEAYSNIRYKDNYDIFAEGLWKNVREFLMRLSYFASYKVYGDYKEYIAEIQTYLSKEMYEELYGVVEQKGKVVKASISSVEGSL